MMQEEIILIMNDDDDDTAEYRGDAQILHDGVLKRLVMPSSKWEAGKCQICRCERNYSLPSLKVFLVPKVEDQQFFQQSSSFGDDDAPDAAAPTVSPAASVTTNTLRRLVREGYLTVCSVQGRTGNTRDDDADEPEEVVRDEEVDVFDEGVEKDMKLNKQLEKMFLKAAK